MDRRKEVQGITIDAQETRDIDDAVWVNKEPDGLRVFVSIADVSRMVQPQSDLDARARMMTATRYFATGNSPMLPRRLSENSLSLHPGLPRKTLTVEFLVKKDFEVSLSGIYLSVLKSKAKVAYSEVPRILDEQYKEHPFHEVMHQLSRLAMGLLERRRAAGALVLYDLNNGWVTTEEGYLRQLEKKEDTIGNIIIQELMILTNAEVARFAVENNIPTLFRNHEARIAAPDRTELMKQIQEATTAPLPTLDLIRQRTHMLLEKAEYGATLKGHYGLNLPAYLHFTSPIRRYADLVTHRQIRSFLQKDPFTYSQEDMHAVAGNINKVTLAERKSMNDHMKNKAEQKAHAAIDSRRIHGLHFKEFERVTKVEARSGNDPSPAFQEGFLARLSEGGVPLLCTTVVLTQAPNTDGWKALKAALIEHLSKKSEDAVSLLAMAVQTSAWPNILYETTREGSDHAPTFGVTASDGTRTSDPIQAPTQKEAKQRAAVALLALCSDLPQPTFTAPAQATVTKKVVHIDWSKDPIMALQEYSQAVGGRVGPNYSFEMGGLSHLPVITCTCKFGEFVKTATAGKKQDAKRLAALAVASAMGKR